jgi:hypothetical protein
MGNGTIREKRREEKRREEFFYSKAKRKSPFALKSRIKNPNVSTTTLTEARGKHQP